MPAAGPRTLLVLGLVGAALVLLAGCGEKEKASLDAGEAATAADGGFGIAGAWRGRLEQKGLKPFAVAAEIRSLDDPSRNTVHYTRVDCSGHWTYVGRDGRGYRFREVIGRGEGDTCKGEGIVVVTPISADRLEYSFTGGGVHSDGVLARMG